MAVNDEYDPEQQVEEQSQLAAKVDKDIQDAKYILGVRKRAYYHMFVEGEVTAEDRRIVLEDLAVFCRQHTTTFHENDRIHALLTGRQEVVLRVSDYMRLDVDELFAKYTKPPER